MKNADLMTPEELRALATEKEKNEVPVKTGTLKHDLYQLEHPYTDEFSLNTLSRIRNIKKKMFRLVLEKGTEFICYMFEGEELWFEFNGTVEEATAEWAHQHLENITTVTVMDVEDADVSLVNGRTVVSTNGESFGSQG